MQRSHTIGFFRSESSNALLGSEEGETVNSRLDSNGFGYYQILLVLGVGVFGLSESIEMGAVAPLHTGLAKAFKMSHTERASLPACVYTGAMMGMILAGPFGDLFGRRGTIMFGIICLLASSLVLAYVPLQAPVWLILCLRGVAGFAGAIGGPAAIALAVESCSSESRVNIIFAMVFLSNIGYMCESIGVAMFLPKFGEGEHDDWRGLCLFIAAPCLLSLPFILLLRESPSLLAVKGRISECIDALNYMAWWNGKPTSMHANVESGPAQTMQQFGNSLVESLACVFQSYLPLMMLLLVIESSRSFFFSGSAYLCKDLFMMTGSLMSPSSMNMLASVTPLVGILIGSRFIDFGVHQVIFVSCLVATSALLLLAWPPVRASALMLLTCVLLFKLTFGPISSCVNLMRAEAFPTAIRATAYGMVCVAGKLLCMLGPVLVESLKGNASAQSWQDIKLALYLFSLAMAAFICGVFSLLVPPKMGNGRRLHDFVVVTPAGRCFNMLDEDQEEALLKEDDHFRPKTGIVRGMTYGSLLHGSDTRGMPL